MRGPLTGAELAAVLDPESDILDEIVSARQGEIIRAMAAEIALHRDAMAPHLLRATRLYTEELGALRKRVAALDRVLYHTAHAHPGEFRAGVRAFVEAMGVSTPQAAEVAEYAGGLYDRGLEELSKRVAELEALVAERSAGEVKIIPAGEAGVILEAKGWRVTWSAGSIGTLDNRFALFAALRDELREADICLACGTHTPGRACQCENDD